MKKSWKLLLVILTIIALATVAGLWKWSRPAPPPGEAVVYQGKPVAEWRRLLLEDMDTNIGNTVPSDEFPLAANLDPEGIPLFVELLRDDEVYVKWAALTCLGRLGPRAKSSVPQVTAILKDRSRTARQRAVFTLEDIASPETVPGLKQALEDPEIDTRCYAARALWKIERIPETILPTLIAILQLPLAEGHAHGAANELETMGPAAKPAVPALIQVLKETKGRDETHGFKWYEGTGPRSSAIRALGKIGPGAKDAIPNLRDAALEGPFIRAQAWVALAKISENAEEAVRTLLGDVEEGDSAAVGWALTALGDLGPEAGGAVPVLVRKIQSGRFITFEKVEAVEALGKIGPQAKEAIPLLQELVKDPDNDRIKDSAKKSLEQIQEADKASKTR